MSGAEPARFFDTRAAYLLFATATTEKATVADRVGEELDHLTPQPPGIRVFDAGMGDASVLTNVMRRMHTVFPRVPWTVVGKEISVEDVRQALAKIPDRLFEHPEMVFAVTNMKFGEAVWLRSESPGEINWQTVPLRGSTSHEFAAQIRDLLPGLARSWRVKTNPRTGNPVYERPSVLVLYRKDHEFLLRSSIPQPEEPQPGFDLIVAAQSYRAATPVERKVSNVVAPLAAALRPGGRLVGVHSTGRDPGMEIIRGVWPEEDPFGHGAAEIVAELARQLGDEGIEAAQQARAVDTIRYEMHVMPSEAAENIGTSSLLATWNAAAYVAQIDETRLSEAMRSGAWESATRRVMESHPTVWFEDEVYVIARRG